MGYRRSFHAPKIRPSYIGIQNPMIFNSQTTRALFISLLATPLWTGCLPSEPSNPQQETTDNDSSDIGTKPSPAIPESATLTMTIELRSNGLVESTMMAVYNASAQLMTQDRDLDGDGVIDEQKNWTYTSAGHVERETTDTNNDGFADSQTQFTYNDQGLVTLKAIDEDGDAVADRQFRYDYNALGLEIFYSKDDDADNQPEFTTRHYYDPNGVLTALEHDPGADGLAVNRHTFSYDAAGNQIERRSDSNGDGVDDWVWMHRFNDQNLLTSRAFDSGVDGTTNQEYFYEYDDNGREILTLSDYNGDGIIDEREITEYDGSKKTVSIDEGDNGTIDWVSAYTFNTQGRLTASVRDSNADGIDDYQITCSYRADNTTLSQYVLDSNRVKLDDRTLTRTFDDSGRLIRETDNNAREVVIQYEGEPRIYALIETPAFEDMLGNHGCRMRQVSR